MKNREEKIIEVLTKYKSSKYEIFIFSFFNSKIFKIGFPAFLFLNFLLGFIFMQNNMLYVTKTILLYTFCFFLLVFIVSFISVKTNNYKIIKISKELDIPIEEVLFLRNHYNI